MPDDKKSPIDNVVELALYAPLGLAITARDHLPDLIARGRQQVASQVMLARVMGQFAVKEGEKDLRKRIDGLSQTLSDLGVRPEPNPAPPAAGGASVPAPPPEVEVDVPGSSSAATANGSSKGSSNGSSKGAASAGTATATATATAAPMRSRADLSIPGYDTLSASQVVQRLAGLTPEELEDVRDYEAGTRGRRTILSKIAQLQSGPSV